MKNKFKKILMIFYTENWLWKSNFGTFDTSPLHQFSKLNNFLWARWFQGKKFSNFVPPTWKLHYLYCHTLHSEAPPWINAFVPKIDGRYQGYPVSIVGRYRTKTKSPQQWGVYMKDSYEFLDYLAKSGTFIFPK